MMQKIDLFRRGLIIPFLLLSLTLSALAALDFKKGSFILDDESEKILTEWTTSLFRVAGLTKYTPKIFIIVDPEINAAASVGGQIFIFSGFIAKCESAGQLLGVLAHEVGHIAGGHVSQSDAAQEKAIIPAVAAVLLGGAAALTTGNMDGLVAGVMGASHLFERGMLKFSRAHESAADQAGLTYLQKLGWPADGLHQFLQMLHTKMLTPAVHLDPYAVTHPLTGDRIEAVRQHIECCKKPRSFPSHFEEKFQRLKAKLVGFLEKPQTVLKLYKESDSSIAAQYGRSIAYYRLGETEKALSLISDLSKKNPQDPYFNELKGQVLFESGRIAEAIPYLRKAVALSPNSPLLNLFLCQALLENDKTNGHKEVIKLLVPVSQKLPENVFVWRLLAMAYGRDQKMGLTALALAEEAYLKEDFDFAENQIKRADKLLENDPKNRMRVADLSKQIQFKQKKKLGQ